MKLRELLDQVIRTTLDGQHEKALSTWTTNRQCTPAECTNQSGSGLCQEICLLPRLLEMSLVSNRDNAYEAYRQLKEFTDRQRK
ncbi:MAG: hypothetical protein HOE62_00445 [Alphaproteobacteria bacterium]|jgi:hypothetical protein|nr:hypothetical protein [Alphaproteobacteria bacterium]MBT4016387.1 hypothetical protein [Alphaproteobacteria bacterium]MBT4965031.1 hypothetical protein [Alphaproteobacteria bacterium]MBT5159567.1 hypothetical protein [Alphaproteobacteria bacterium]MBT7748021.1 hypothetical protein [Alphaproteobacteria bacterium]